MRDLRTHFKSGDSATAHAGETATRTPSGLAIGFVLLAAAGTARSGTLTVQYELFADYTHRPPAIGMMSVRFPVSDIDPLQFITNGNGRGGGTFTLLSLETSGVDNALLVREGVFRWDTLFEDPGVHELRGLGSFGGHEAVFLTGPARSMVFGGWMSTALFAFIDGVPARGFLHFSAFGTTIGVYDSIVAHGAEVSRTFEPAPEAPVPALCAAAAVAAAGLLRWRARSLRG